MRKILITAIASLAVATSAMAAPSILSLRDTITDNSIVYPESFEDDTKAMMENWYLQNYTVLDRNADSKTSVEATDEVLIERLSKMPTVIEMPFNSIVRNYIDMYAERKKGLVENMLGMSLYYMPIFEQALDKYGLPMELKYLPVIESALNPNAVSRAGATGLWQFMTATATSLGLEVNSIVDERRDPIASSDAAARYLQQLYNTFGDWSLAIAAYNCGPGNVNKAIRRAGGGKKDFWEIYSFLPSETRGYVPAFIAANYVMTYYGDHNISPALARRPLVTDSVNVSRRVHFKQISDVMNIPIEEIRVLNPQYRTDLIPGDIKPYPLVLPTIQAYCYIANEDSIVNHDAELYARRDVVEPSDGSSKGTDSKGEYVEELVVKYHKVKRGETLASIAKRYGVTTSSISKANNIGKRVKRGQTLKINTYKRRYVESVQVADSTAVTAATDSLNLTPAVAVDSVAVDSVAVDSVAASPQAEQVKSSIQSSTQNSKKSTATTKKNNSSTKSSTKKETTRTVTVHKGQNLSKIARQYGTTVDAIKKLNGMTNDKIQIGQKLKVPSK